MRSEGRQVRGKLLSGQGEGLGLYRTGAARRRRS